MGNYLQKFSLVEIYVSLELKCDGSLSNSGQKAVQIQILSGLISFRL